jgi:hypothetical protein
MSLAAVIQSGQAKVATRRLRHLQIRCIACATAMDRFEPWSKRAFRSLIEKLSIVSSGEMNYLMMLFGPLRQASILSHA